MKKLLIAALLCVPLAAGAEVKPASPRFPYAKHIEKLDNGLTVVVVPMKTPGLMAWYSLVRVGSRNEVEPGKSGFAHFFEHMMFRGTKNVSQDARNAFLKEIGADDNGFTTDDFTCYTVFGSNTKMDELARIEADRMMNLSYSKPDFRTEARAILGEYNKSFSNPGLLMEEKLFGAAFTKHTYRHTTIGFLEDIKAMPEQYDYSLKFFGRYYRPDNVILVVTGDVNPDATLALVKKHYSPWAGKTNAAKLPAEPPQTKERRVEVPWDAETAPRFLMGWHTPAEDLSKMDSAVQLVLGELLLGSASPLYADLVLDRGLVESFGNGTYPHRDPNLFYFLTTYKKAEDEKEIRATIERQIAKLAAGEVDAKLLEDVKSAVRYGVLTGLETPNAVADQLVFTIGPNGDPEALEKSLSSLEKVGVQDVATFVKTHLTDANRTTATLVMKKKGGSR